MYLASFGLAEKPFAITPDPRYLYLGTQHADALAHLVYGIREAGGFVQLTGEVGTGKTTTIRSLLARAPQNADIALLINPRLSPLEFLQSICEELGVALPDGAGGSQKQLLDQLNRQLLSVHAAGRRAVLIVDEAQQLAVDVLEQLRLLTNLETESQKLLQIILIGQPELRELLGRNDLRQLAQRVTARCHLEPLAREDTAAYVRHRLRVAGATGELFDAAALRAVHRLSGGVPRVINVLCDRALLAAYSEDRHAVSARLVRRAAREVFARRGMPTWAKPAFALGALLLLAAALLALWRYAPGPGPRPGEPLHAAAGLAGRPPGGGATATAPAAPAPALSGLLAAAPDAAHADGALAGLMKLWQARYAPGEGDPCTQALAQGLYCVTLQSSLAQLGELRRPAVLTLGEHGGASRQVLLTGIGTDAVQLQIGAHSARVSIAELSRYWYGDCTLLWRPAALPPTELRPGMHGAAVRTLRRQLLQAAGVAAGDAGGGGANFDPELARRVEEFQRAHHLAVDGIAGVETQLLLDAMLAPPGTPLLQTVTTAVAAAPSRTPA